MPKTLTLADWAEDTKRRARLTEILDDPVFLDAIATLQRVFAEAAPDVVSVNSQQTPPNAADLTTLLALRHTHRSGFFGYLNALHNLTKDRPQRPKRDGFPGFLPEDQPLPKDRKKP